MRAATSDTSSSALDALALLARRTSSARLAGLEVVGLATALAVATAFPDKLALVLPFVGIGMFGLWGTVDRFRLTRQHAPETWPHWSLSLLQLLAATVGSAAIAALIYVIVGRAIGTVVS